MENARQNAQFYTTRLVEYLCNNLRRPGIQFEHVAGYAPQRTAYYQNGMTISGGHDQIDPDLARKLPPMTRKDNERALRAWLKRKMNAKPSLKTTPQDNRPKAPRGVA